MARLICRVLLTSLAFSFKFIGKTGFSEYDRKDSNGYKGFLQQMYAVVEATRVHNLVKLNAVLILMETCEAYIRFIESYKAYYDLT